MGSPTRSNHSNPNLRRISAGASGGGGVQQKLGDEGEDKPEKIFISSHYADRSKVALIRSQAKRSETMEFQDVSLKEEVKSKNWKPEAKKCIARCDQVIVVVGKETAQRKSVKWEILEALRQGKPIVVVRLNGDAKDPLPENVKENGAVSWNLEDIQDEIDKNREERDEDA